MSNRGESLCLEGNISERKFVNDQRFIITFTI